MAQGISASLHDQLHAALASREDELITLHRALVSIPSVNRGDGTSANETAVCDLAFEYLKAIGVNVSIHEGEPGRGNLLAEIGHGSRRMLWMSHSDVVPAGDEAAWTHPPFSATLANGRIYGRGSNDCKMLVAAQLFTLACLARMERPRKGRLALAMGADEEVGGFLGFGWLMKERTDFLRADLAICEGGGNTLGRLGGKHPVIGVSTGDKGRYDVEFRVTSDGGHACAPWKVFNPMSVIQQLLTRLQQWQPEAWPASPIFEYVENWLATPKKITAETLEAAIAEMQKKSPGFAVSLRGQSRMTLTPTMIRGGDKANQIPTEIRLGCDARLLPGQTIEDLEKLAAQMCDGLNHVTWTVVESSAPSVSPWNRELEGMFQRAAEKAVGEPVEVVPTWCIGATDARYVRVLDTPVYGFQLIHPKADTTRLDIHCIDESIEAGMLLPCALALGHFAVDFFGEG